MKTFGFQWHVTDRCNQRCAHCYQDDYSAASEKGVDALCAMADRIFGGVAGREVSVNVTGGEPLLFPHIFDLIGHLSTFPNLREVNIITNATIATDEVVERLGRAAKVGWLKVSIESADEARNDAIRGKGNFARVVAGIERYRAIGRPVVLMSTLGAYNLAEIDGVVALARKVGAAGVIFERFVPLGAGRAIAHDVLDRAGWAQAVTAIARAAGVDAGPDDLLPYRAFWLWTDGRKGGVLDGALCNLGDQSMALMPDGTVYPCRRLPVPTGNVLTDPFAEILARLEKFGVDVVRPHLRGEFCGICGVDDCAGCRALARAVTGDLLADDPQCALQVEP